MLTLLFTDSRGERNNRENLLPSALHPPLQSLGSFSLYHPSLSPLVLCLPLSLSFIPFFSLLLLAPILEICLLLLSIPRYLTLAVIPLFGNLLLLSPFSTLSTLHSLSITAGLLYEDDSSRLCFHSPSLLSSPNPPVPPPHPKPFKSSLLSLQLPSGRLLASLISSHWCTKLQIPKQHKRAHTHEQCVAISVLCGVCF